MSNTIQNTKKRKVNFKKDLLTSSEVSKLLVACETNRYAVRDQALILLAFRHGLRATEATTTTWNQIDLDGGRFTVYRLKGSEGSVQVLEPDEVRLLKKLKSYQPNSLYVFVTERGTPMDRDCFRKLMRAAGKKAGFDFSCHPHQLRHGAGHALAMQNQSTRSIQHFLGHKNLNHVIRYTRMHDSAFLRFGKLIGGKLPG